MVLVPCGVSLSGGILITSPLGKLAALRIHSRQSAAADDLMKQQLSQIGRAVALTSGLFSTRFISVYYAVAVVSAWQ